MKAILKTIPSLLLATVAITTTGLAVAQENDPIIIGAAISLTTEQAIAGQQQKVGIMMAIDEINKAGGVPGKGNNRSVTVVFADNGNSPTKAVKDRKSTRLNSST